MSSKDIFEKETKYPDGSLRSDSDRQRCIIL